MYASFLLQNRSGVDHNIARVNWDKRDNFSAYANKRCGSINMHPRLG